MTGMVTDGLWLREDDMGTAGRGHRTRSITTRWPMPNLALCPRGGEKSPIDFMPTVTSLLRKLSGLTGSSDRKERSGIHLERGLGIAQMPSPSEGPLGRGRQEGRA